MSIIEKKIDHSHHTSIRLLFSTYYFCLINRVPDDLTEVVLPKRAAQASERALRPSERALRSSERALRAFERTQKQLFR